MNNYKLWDLLNDYIIRIPLIQRDYVQGVNEKIKNKFLNDIYITLTNEKDLSLDFIYGYIDNKNIFIPLDGQQRLTTLYLLHLYLAWKEKRLIDSIVEDKFKKFEYEVRSSSKEFFSVITKLKEIKFSSTENSISNFIQNKYWFRKEWIKDITIKAILSMLDGIHRKFKDCELELFNELIDKPKIYFKFICIEKLSQTDDLYIKLNVRGKPLSKFENLKASLEERINGFTVEEKEEILDFKNKIDNEWTDLFWKFSNKNINVFEKYTFNFYTQILEYNFLLTDKLLDLDWKNDIFKYLKYIDCKLLKSIQSFLNHIVINDNQIKFSEKYDQYHNEEEIFRKILENKSLTYANRLIFYAYFLAISRAELEDINLYHWLRILNNLIYNQYYNKEDDYIKSLKSIRALYEDVVKESNFNILELISNFNYKIESFYGAQVEEEKLKSSLIMKNTKWNYLIENAENHGYLKGNIGFIFDMVKVSTEEEKYSMDLFVDYYHKIKEIFDNNGLKDIYIKNEIFRRALLVKGDYLLNGTNQCFCTNNDHRDRSWKRYFKDRNVKELKFLLDDIKIENIESSLKEIIENGKLVLSKENWRYLFLEYSEMFKFCEPYLLIKKGYRGIENNILLLSSTRTSGYCSENQSLALYFYLKSKYKNIKIEYEKNQGMGSLKGFTIKTCREFYITHGEEWNVYRDWGINIPPIISFKTKEEILKFIENKIIP